jgi:hypothetical protein
MQAFSFDCFSAFLDFSEVAGLVSGEVAQASSSRAAFPWSAVLKQLVQLHLCEQKPCCLKHSQYNFKHLLFRQLQNLMIFFLTSLLFLLISPQLFRGTRLTFFLTKFKD